MLILALLLSVPQPPIERVLRLIGRFSAAHACPVAPRLAYTNAHVVDQRPFDLSIPPYPFFWSDETGRVGFVIPTDIERGRDLAALEPVNPGDVFPYVFPVTKRAPEVGERVFLLGYDWTNKNRAMADDVIKAKVVRVLAGHVIFTPSGLAGSSGSCILNEGGEVIGINEGSYETDDNELAGIGVGIWGNLREMPFPEGH